MEFDDGIGEFVERSGVLMGREREFRLALGAVDRMLRKGSGTFRVCGRPYQGKISFCREVLRWYSGMGLTCVELPGDETPADGCDIALLSGDAEDGHAPDAKVVLSASLSPPVSGRDHLVLEDYARRDALRLIDRMTGCARAAERSADRLRVDIPRSPLVLESLCRELITIDPSDDRAVDSVMMPVDRRASASNLVNPGHVGLVESLAGSGSESG